MGLNDLTRARKTYSSHRSRPVAMPSGSGIANGTAEGQLLEWSGTAWTPGRQYIAHESVPADPMGNGVALTGTMFSLETDETVTGYVVLVARNAAANGCSITGYFSMTRTLSTLGGGLAIIYNSTTNDPQETLMTVESYETGLCCVYLYQNEEALEATVRVQLDRVRNGVTGGA